MHEQVRELTSSLRIDLKPDIDDLVHGHEFVLPRPHLLLEGFDVGGIAHCLRLNHVVVQQHLNVVNC